MDADAFCPRRVCSDLGGEAADRGPQRALQLGENDGHLPGDELPVLPGKQGQEARSRAA